MFKKFSSGILIIILAVLMIAYLIVRYSKSDDRTFRDKVLEFDPSVVTEIIIEDPKVEQEPIGVVKSGGKWMVRIGTREYNADTSIVKNILTQLSDLTTKRYAGKGSEIWEKYEVSDTTAILVTIKSDNKTIGGVRIGKFSYNMPKEQQQLQMQGRQQRGEMTSYVRLDDEKDVYAVDGYLKMTFSNKPESYRNRNLSALAADDITRITVTDPGNRKVYDNPEGKWLMNGAPADSATVVRYRSSLARLTGTKFYNDDLIPSSATHSVLLEGNNFAPIEIKAYPVADTTVNYVITSTANPGSYFNGKEGGLFGKIWK